MEVERSHICGDDLESSGALYLLHVTGSSLAPRGLRIIAPGSLRSWVRKWGICCFAIQVVNLGLVHGAVFMNQSSRFEGIYKVVKLFVVQEHDVVPSYFSPVYLSEAKLCF